MKIKRNTVESSTRKAQLNGVLDFENRRIEPFFAKKSDVNRCFRRPAVHETNTMVFVNEFSFQRLKNLGLKTQTKWFRNALRNTGVRNTSMDCFLKTHIFLKQICWCFYTFLLHFSVIKSWLTKFIKHQREPCFQLLYEKIRKPCCRLWRLRMRSLPHKCTLARAAVSWFCCCEGY